MKGENAMNKLGVFNYYDEPEGCAACGGDYPNCTTSCPLFDD